MPLSQRRQKLIIDALNQKKGNHLATCPMCGHQRFSLGEGFVGLTVQDQPEPLTLGGPYYPLLPVFCNNCGTAQFVNLRMLGLTDLAEGSDADAELPPIPPPPAFLRDKV